MSAVFLIRWGGWGSLLAARAEERRRRRKRSRRVCWRIVIVAALWVCLGWWEVCKVRVAEFGGELGPSHVKMGGSEFQDAAISALFVFALHQRLVNLGGSLRAVRRTYR